MTSNNREFMSTHNVTKPSESAITEAIKFIKSQLPQTYKQWKEASPNKQPQTMFQSHLVAIEYMFTVQAYSRLRVRVLDQVLIKLRFFAMNESYLLQFEAYLMLRFLQFVNKAFGMVFGKEKLGQLSNNNPSNKLPSKQLKQITERYSILLQCLVKLLRYCLCVGDSSNNKTVSLNNNNQQQQQSRQQNPMMVSKTTTQQSTSSVNGDILQSGEFATFILSVLEEKVQEIFQWKILEVRQIYPLLFSTLTEAMLQCVLGKVSVSGGSRVIQMIGRVIVKLVRENNQSVAVKLLSSGSNNINNTQTLTEQVKRLLTDGIISGDTDKNKNRNNSVRERQMKTDYGNNNINPVVDVRADFEQMCRQRMVIFLQRLLQPCGYQFDSGSGHDGNLGTKDDVSCCNDDNISITLKTSSTSTSTITQQQEQLSQNKLKKLAQIVENLARAVVIMPQCINTINNISVDNKITNNQQYNRHVVTCLILLKCEFNSDHHVANNNEVDRNYRRQEEHQLLEINSKDRDLLAMAAAKDQQISSKLRQLFMAKFRLLINKNKTISTVKTTLLKQLNRMLKYVRFGLQDQEFLKREIFVKLRLLFEPSQQQMNRPLIIPVQNIINKNTNLAQSYSYQQSLPLIRLQPQHSVSTYPISMQSSKQSLMFEQQKNILYETRVFDWFESQQTNLKLFKQLLCGFGFDSKLLMLEYFLQELIRTKAVSYSNNNKDHNKKTQNNSNSFYSLQMSLHQFYQTLTLQFYIHLLLSPQANILSATNYISNKKVYTKSVTKKLQMLYELIVGNADMKRLLVGNKDEELFVYWAMDIMYRINGFFCQVKESESGCCGDDSRYIKLKSLKYSHSNRMSLLHSKMVLAQNLIQHYSHRTYLLQLFLTTSLLQFSSPDTLSQSLKPILSTLIHRNAGSINNHNDQNQKTTKQKQCNLEFIQNLLKLSQLNTKQSEQLAALYLEKQFITQLEATQVISLLFKSLTPETMRKCILSVKNWPVLLAKRQNLILLNNQPLMQQPKQALFHANDGDNVTVSNALGVIVLELDEKWLAQLQFSNPRKQILIDAMIALIETNDELIFWRQFFFQNILKKLVLILKEIEVFVGCQVGMKGNKKQRQPTQQHKQKQVSSRRIALYERIHNKILFHLLYKIKEDNFKYIVRANSEETLRRLRQLQELVLRQVGWLRRQCFVNSKYQLIEKYKMAGALLERIQCGLRSKQEYRKVNDNVINSVRELESETSY